MQGWTDVVSAGEFDAEVPDLRQNDFTFPVATNVHRAAFSSGPRPYEARFSRTPWSVEEWVHQPCLETGHSSSLTLLCLLSPGAESHFPGALEL